MARPTKHYSRELALMSLMAPGDCYSFPAKHPRGLLSKMYQFIAESKLADYKLSVDNHTYVVPVVVVTKSANAMLVTPEVYKAHGL